MTRFSANVPGLVYLGWAKIKLQLSTKPAELQRLISYLTYLFISLTFLYKTKTSGLDVNTKIALITLLKY